MNLNEMIYKRKSVRSYTGQPVDAATLESIRSFAAGIKPLYPDIRYNWEFVSKDQVKCILPWITPQLIAIFSENKPGYLENAGFLFQQMDLYLQSIGLGVCWLGMGRMNAQDIVGANSGDGMQFVMLLAFGHPKGDALRGNAGEFKRKSLAEIADRTDDRLEPARLAPSSVNSQPWYFSHEGETIHTYCAERGLLKKALGDMNLIDMGIALAHMYVANPDTFRFFKAGSPAPAPVPGHGYIGSFTI